MRDAGEDLTVDQKKKVFKKFKSYKAGSNTDGVAFKEITNEHIGLKTPLHFKQIKPLMKAWRQEINNLESPVQEVTVTTPGG